MAEYIERAELISAIKTCKSMMNTGFPKQNMTQKDMMRIIEEMPAADVAPVVHSSWVGFPNNEVWDLRCDKCHLILPFGHRPETMHYCPNCGAKIDGGKHETD